MNMKRGNILLSIIAVLTMMSCSSMKVVEYSVKRTPNILLTDTVPTTLLYNVKSISVENNQTFLQLKDTVVQKIYKRMSEEITDRGMYLDEKNNIIANPTSQPLNNNQAKEYEGDNIISLNKVSINPYYRLGTIDEDWHFVDLYIPTELHISVLPYRGDTIFSYSCVDTLVFSGAGYTRQEAINSLPSHNECVDKLVTSISKVASMQYLPITENYARLYFASNDRMMRKADKFWREGKYDEASYIWNYLYESKRSRKLQAKTAANMAMYEEMKHNYDSSLMWARISFALFSRKKSVFDPEIAYLSDYIQQLRLDLREQLEHIKDNIYSFE